METANFPLLVHAETCDPNVDIFDRESDFLQRILYPIVYQFPKLRVVLEHISTASSIQFVLNHPDTLAATITPQHLLFNRNDLLANGIKPHLYCRPILKTESDRRALLCAATSGCSQFFIGTDCAPHSKFEKECACNSLISLISKLINEFKLGGNAGIFSAHAAIELYAEAFESVGKLDMLENFTSKFGQMFYQIPQNTERIVLTKQEWKVPLTYSFGRETVVPLRANDFVKWKVM
jgi:dihydroorotase